MKPSLALIAGSLALTLTAATPPKNGEVAVTVTDLRSEKGVVLACMTADRKTFPNCRKDPNALRVRAPAGERVELLFTDVAPGQYAIALLHDENKNGKADRVLGMMPKEGFGFSRDAKVKMAPPKFDDAAFEYAGEAKVLTIKMRYML